jgi:phosphatidylglycerol:prolipoprotein diacylglycerol transferase
MRQVLFWIPTPWGDLPIYGFGFMLFITFVTCYWLLGKRAEKEGIARQHLQDLAVWIFVAGLVGARLVFMIQYHVDFWPPWNFFKIWEGGLVFYGAALGGLAGYVLAYYFIIRKHGLDTLQLADILAPAVALGLSLGRIGCLLNGCCYGHVACADCPAVHFPMSAPARFTLTANGYQTAAGFALYDRDKNDPTGRTVRAVEPDSPAALDGGLKPRDVIVGLGEHSIGDYEDLWVYMAPKWERGQTLMKLTVLRNGVETKLPPFTPRTLGLHPTQIYETISAGLIFLLLLAFEPFRRRRGELMVILMLCYSVHRFLNESIRNDTDKVAFDMTLSQNGSIVVFLGALVLLFYISRRPVVEKVIFPEPDADRKVEPEPDEHIRKLDERIEK